MRRTLSANEMSVARRMARLCHSTGLDESGFLSLMAFVESERKEERHHSLKTAAFFALAIIAVCLAWIVG